jgi:mono/diheme cytochrome c family protein
MNPLVLVLIGGPALVWAYVTGIHAVNRPTAPPSDDRPDPVQRYMRARRRRWWYIVGALVFLLGTAAFWTLLAEVPEDHQDIREHFKYGSIGADSASGIPYWIWWVLPDMFPQYLPEPERFLALSPEARTPRSAYEQFGFIYEEGHLLPIGFSTRRVQMTRVGLNCAACHTSTVRVTPGMDPTRIYGAEPGFAAGGRDRAIVLGMPAATVDLSAYIRFLHNCANDPGFTTDAVMGAIAARTTLNLLDRIVYKLAVPTVQQTLRQQSADFTFLRTSPPPGPGRVDTFNPYKTHVFKFPGDGTVGTADFPSLWNQRPREGLRLHWDGNNTSVFERNISASIGGGATPVSLDLPRMIRVATWIGAPDPHHDLTAEEIAAARLDPRPHAGELPIPRFPFAVDDLLAARGRAIYTTHCANCHDWKGSSIGEVVPIAAIGTDPNRLDSYTPETAAAQNTLGAGTWWRFRHFRKTQGYANMPLDGLWARAPYLHNGSVHSLAELLEPAAKRAKWFYRGDDEYDPVNVGFRSDRERALDGRKLFRYDCGAKGNAATGHEYGTTLPPDQKKALLEYLKTL